MKVITSNTEPVALYPQVKQKYKIDEEKQTVIIGIPPVPDYAAQIYAEFKTKTYGLTYGITLYSDVNDTSKNVFIDATTKDNIKVSLEDYVGFGILRATSIDVSKVNWNKIQILSKALCGGTFDDVIDFTKWNTSNVVDMSHMFESCTFSTNQNFRDVIKLNTSKVKNMSYMFADTYVKGTTTPYKIDVTGLNTVNVEDMSYMFFETVVTKIDFDTSKVKTMKGMFSCNNNIGVDGKDGIFDLTSFNTSNVEDMSYMFKQTPYIRYYGKGIDMSSFDTSKVKDMSYMFAENDEATDIDLSNFDTRNVINVSHMFENDKKLTKPKGLETFNMSNVKDMCYIFHNCNGFKQLDLSNWNTSNVENMEGMFEDCDKITSLNVSSWDTSNVKNMGSMFEYCYGLTSLDLSNWNTYNVENIKGMFASCKNLKSLNISNFDLTNAKFDTSTYKLNFVFNNCPALTEVNVSNCNEYTKNKILSLIKDDLNGEWFLGNDGIIRKQ